MIPYILLKALFKGKLESSPDYEIYEKAFLPKTSASEKESIYKQTSENFKLDVMKGDNEACHILAKAYRVGFYVPKDEYIANLLTLIGYALENDKHKKVTSACPIKCQKCEEYKNIINFSPPEYEILKPTANNFFQNYIGRYDITFDDAILSAACTTDNSVLGGENYMANYNV